MSAADSEAAVAAPAIAETSEAQDVTPIAASTGETAPMSKNALKRLRKAQEWEDGRDDRRKRRKERRVGRKLRAREEKAALVAQGVDPESLVPAKPAQAQLVPVALLLDCDFESYMTDKERVSLSSQVTRSYSDNRNARYRSHLWIAGWGGRLRERFNTVMHNQHHGWKGVDFEEGDFLACADGAVAKMTDPDARISGKPIDALARGRQGFEMDTGAEDVPPLDERYADNVVYLTSDSPHTLHRLEANTCYVIGGLVDKNREKGLCYRRATERGIRTAKLPIGEYMVMQSRQVLATNHVVEIMLRWLECEDWGEAFLRVIPKRKGGTLKSAEAGDEPEDDDASEAGKEAESEAEQDNTTAGEEARET